MLTLNPITTNKNNNTTINFGYKLPRRVFHDIRDIPHLRCACCNEDMLTKSEIWHFKNSFLAGSKRALENSAMDPYRDTPAFELVRILSEIAPKKTISQLAAMPENKFKIRMLGVKDQLDFNMIKVISDGISVKAPRVMQKLEKYRDFFGEEDSAILQLMDMYAQMYPKKTFAEIFNTPEIAQQHKEAHRLNTEQESAARINVFKRLKEFADTLDPKDAKELRRTNTRVISALTNEYYEGHIKRGLVEDYYNEFLNGARGKVSKRKLRNIIKEFPCSGMTPDKFVSEVVDNKMSDMDIVMYFVQRLQATKEHFVAKSDMGADKQKNIIVLCQKCNRERSNLPYPFFLRFHPEMIRNLPKQINKIIAFIRHGKLIGYDEYPVASKKIILENSDDILRPKIGGFLKFKKQKAEQKLNQARGVLEQDQETFDLVGQKLDSVDARIKQLENEIKKLKKERQPIVEEYQAAEKVHKDLQEQVDRKQRVVDEIQEVIDNDRAINESLKYKRRTRIKKSK